MRAVLILMSLLFVGCVENTQTETFEASTTVSTNVSFEEYDNGAVIAKCDDNDNSDCILYVLDEEYRDINNTDTDANETEVE